MGNIYSRNGIFYVDLRVQGRRIRKKAGKIKKLAELMLNDLEIKAERNQLGFLDRKDISIKVLLEEFRRYSQANHRPASQARYRAVVNNFLEFIQKETQINRLSQINGDTIEKYRMYRRSGDGSGVKAYTINFEVRALRTIFYFAIRSNFMETNPVKGFKFLKTDDSKKRRFLSDQECVRLLRYASKDDYPIFATFLNTGMRRAELVHLEWSDVDLKKRIIKIQKKPNWLPKSGEREIPINDALYEILKRLPDRGSFVFTNDKGNQVDPDLIRLKLIETAKRAQIENLTELHALRHTFASQLIARGVDLPTVQKLMGHTNIQTTMIYTHQTTDHLQNAISKLNFKLSDKHTFFELTSNRG